MENITGINNKISFNSESSKRNPKLSIDEKSHFNKTLNSVNSKKLKNNINTKKIAKSNNNENDLSVEKESLKETKTLKDALKKMGISEEDLKDIDSNDELKENLMAVLQSLFLNVDDKFMDNKDFQNLKEKLSDVLNKTLEVIKTDKSSMNSEINNLSKELNLIFKDMINSMDKDKSFKLKDISEGLQVLLKNSLKHLEGKNPSKDAIENLVTKIKKILVENDESNHTMDTQLNFKTNIENVKSLISSNGDYNKESQGFSKEQFSKEDNVLNSIVKENGSKDFSKAINFLNKFNNNLEVENVVPTENMVINKATLAEDVIKTVKFMDLNGIKDLTVKINPKELGEVFIKVTMENGLLKASISAKNKEAFNMLNANMDDITNKLQNTEVKIQNLNLNLYEDTTFYNEKRGNYDGQSRKNHENFNESHENSIDALEEKEENSSEDLSNINMLA